MWIERVIAVFCVVCAVFILGWLAGRAHYRRKNKLMRAELERLRNWKKGTKWLCDKLQDGSIEKDFDAFEKEARRRGRGFHEHVIVKHGDPRKF